MMTRNIGIYVFDEVEVLDFAGPYEVFSTASRVHARTAQTPAALFAVHLIADQSQPVRARGGLTVASHCGFAQHPQLDVLIVPGGDVTRELERPHVISWIANAASSALVTASVCTGAFLLARAGLLDDRRATTHWEDIDHFRKTFPSVKVEEGPRWIDEGRIVTSAGIAAGIDMCLHLVGRIAGAALAVTTARQMDYPWQSVTPLSPHT